MKNKKYKYLSSRLWIIWICLGSLTAFLLILSFTLVWKAEKQFIWVWLICLILFILLLWGTVIWIIKPYQRMEKNIRLFLEGYTSGNLTDETVGLTPAGELMAKRLLGMLDSSELLKLNKRQAQYLALQNQINPHFLYNTLESIRSEALIAGLISVADMTEALAGFFRYTISKVENLVSVEEEIQNCETYFKIQQYRFGERVQLTIEYNNEDREEIFACRIPKLTMQPILENSIIHGTECKLGTGHLKIYLERTGKRLLIRISDDGVGMDAKSLAKMNERLEKSAGAMSHQEPEHKGGIALVNVNNRIHLLFGEEYGLHVFSMPGIGTDVEITLPAITSDRDVPNKEALAER